MFQKFWFDAWVENGTLITSNGDQVDTLYEFNAFIVNNGTFDPASLDSTKTYCVAARAVGLTKEFEYELTDCDTTKYRRICFRHAYNCSYPVPGTTGWPGRRKRQVEGNDAEGTLDTVFLETKKNEREKQAKEAQEAYASNFRKMNLQKSYSSLFEIMW